MMEVDKAQTGQVRAGSLNEGDGGRLWGGMYTGPCTLDFVSTSSCRPHKEPIEVLFYVLEAEA